MGHGGPKGGHAARLHRHSITADEIRERAAIEKVDLDFIVPIGPQHLPRLPHFACESIRREVAASAIEVAQRLALRKQRLATFDDFFRRSTIFARLWCRGHTRLRPRKTADKRPSRPELGGNLEIANLSIVQVLTGIQGDLKRFLEAY
ncbi:MAG: hypothetical protein AB7U97_12015 [Pirellulales bacterium]